MTPKSPEHAAAELLTPPVTSPATSPVTSPESQADQASQPAPPTASRLANAPEGGSRFSPYVLHPWHGVSAGSAAPEIVTVYIEMVPTDTVKYEVDKLSGHLKLDRPQKYSSQCPAPYGFIPQTYCGPGCGQLAGERTSRSDVVGDGDPLDVCVLTERTINHGGILVTARPIGGFRMFDGNEADDKIVAVLVNDAAYGDIRDLRDCPASLIERLRHYFLTYKDMPEDVLPTTPGYAAGMAARPSHSQSARRVEITHVYDAAEARQVILCTQADYRNLRAIP
jgi:inorganic pyrophosphatase